MNRPVHSQKPFPDLKMTLAVDETNEIINRILGLNMGGVYLLKNKVLWIVLGGALLLYLNNSSWMAKPAAGRPFLVAHRGLGQEFSRAGITNETNTARRIYPPEHPYLENTISSMERAFALGAAVVELDVHLTRDGQFAVFHDWTLDYRTNGQGVTREHSMAELKQLDIGYGYTADGGKTFPFRGKGVGLMPTLDEVMRQFPRRELLIDIKSNDPREGEALAQYLARFSPQRQAQLAVYGGDRPIATLHRKLPGLRVMSKESLLKGLLRYLAIGWTGYVPESCRNTEIHLPLKYARFLWGWPNRFLQRMAAVNTRVVLVQGNGKFSEGFDHPEDLKRLPPGYTGYIWTNRIDRIGPVDGK